MPDVYKSVIIHWNTLFSILGKASIGARFTIKAVSLSGWSRRQKQQEIKSKGNKIRNTEMSKGGK